MTNRTVYILAKRYEEATKEATCSEDVRKLRRELRAMFRNGDLTSGQRDYIVGRILKQDKYNYACCIGNYYCLGNRIYSI